MSPGALSDAPLRARRTLPGRAALALLLVLAFAVGLVSLRYLSGDPAIVPPSMHASFTANGWIFLAHATASALALMLGALQLPAGPRSRRPRLHRWTGRLYVGFCILGGLSALWIAPDVEGNGVAALGFSALALAWLGATAQGWRHAAGRRFDLHRRWMLRSYALTAAAISLRLQLAVFEAFGLDYVQVSAVLSLSCWLPNLAIAEVAIRLPERQREAG